jgi:hypothetical protein
MKANNNGKLDMQDAWYLSFKEKLNDAIRTLNQNITYKMKPLINRMNVVQTPNNLSSMVFSNSSVSEDETIYTETPVGAIDSLNVTYTVDNTINSVITFNIGSTYIHPVEYSFVGSTITFVTPLDSSLSALSFTIVYR